MEVIVITIMYFGLLGLMIYKGASTPEVLAAAATFVTAYWGFRPKFKANDHDKKEEDNDDK